MKFCQHCGKELPNEATVCSACGWAFQKNDKPSVKRGAPVRGDQSVSVGLVILSVLFPLFGLIYWGVKRSTRPKCAKACGIAAVVTVLVNVLISIIFGSM